MDIGRGMGRLSGGAPLRCLGSKGIQRGSGETRQIWDIGRRGKLVATGDGFIIVYFIFWKSWIKNFVHLFREKEGEETVSNVFFFVYRNNERVLRIIRKRREKNRGNSV